MLAEREAAQAQVAYVKCGVCGEISRGESPVKWLALPCKQGVSQYAGRRVSLKRLAKDVVLAQGFEDTLA